MKTIQQGIFFSSYFSSLLQVCAMKFYHTKFINVALLVLTWKLFDCFFPSLHVDMVALNTAVLDKGSHDWIHQVILPCLTLGKVRHSDLEYYTTVHYMEVFSACN